MEITIPDDALRSLCEQNRLAVRKLGAQCARKLRSRLADLQAAADVRELVTGHPHPLSGDRLGQFAVSLHGGVRLVIEPDHASIPCRPDGSIDWTQVTQVRVIYVGDYHD